MTTGLARQSLHLTASSSSSKSRRYHRYPRQRGGGGRREEVVVVNTTTNSNKKISPTTKTTHVVALLGSLGTSLLASQSSVLFSAFAEEASASGSEISPFAGVVDIAALGLLGVFAYLGNKKSSENVQSERQKTITNMPSRRNRTPPPKPK